MINEMSQVNVVSSRSGVRGWLDAGEMGNWLRLVGVSNTAAAGNLKHVLLKGQIFYETLRDVSPGEELLLSRKSTIDLDSSNADDQTSGSGDDTADYRASIAASAAGGSSESGAAEDDIDDDEGICHHQCLQCDKNFNDYDTLDEHLVAAHGYAAGQCRCEYCPRAFAWRPNLIQHKRIHGEFKRYTCETCSRVFTDPAVLQKHIRTQHVGARAHACPECGKTFATSSGLKQHTHIHSSVKPFQCEVCLKAYTQFSNLCRHKRMHADCRLQIRCHKCNQAFSTQTSLVKHKRFCDTAPSMSTLQAGHSTMPEFNKLPPSNYGMRSLQASPPSSLMMYPRPPLPMLPQSILGNYPMFPNLPPLVGGPQHPLITSSLLLPFQRNVRENKGESHDHSDNDRNVEDTNHRDSGGGLRKNYSPLSVENHDVKAEHEPVGRVRARTPLLSPKRELVSPSKESLRESDDSMDQSKNRSDVEDSVMASPRRLTPSPHFEKYDPLAKMNARKESTPLDLTMRREDMKLFSIKQMSTSSSQQEVTEDKSIMKYNPPTRKLEYRGDHPFLSISDLLKEPTPRTPPAPPVPPTSLTETPTKYPLAYPRPLHPSYLFDMCRNLERTNQERAHLMPPSGSPRSYPMMSSFFSPSAMGGMGGIGLGLGRNPNLDLIKAQMTVSSRPYPDLSRSYDLMPTQIARPKDRYACRFCGKVFPRSANLTRHLRTHTGEQPYKCKFCERSFSISSNLQRHVRNIHNKERPFRCHLCDRSFGQQTNLDRHLRHHDEGGPENPDSNTTAETPVKFFSDEIRSFVVKVTDPSNEDVPEDMDEEEEEEKEIRNAFVPVPEADFTSDSLSKRQRIE